MDYNRIKKSSGIRNSRGAALIELAITFPLALTIVLAAVHISDVLRESIVVTEAAKHGARAVTAASHGMTIIPGLKITDLQCPADPSTTPAVNLTAIAWVASCAYLQEYFDSKWTSDYDNWLVTAEVGATDEDGINFPSISVTLKAANDRGPIDVFIPFIHLRPETRSVYPLMQVGSP